MLRAHCSRVLAPLGLAALLAPPLACTKSGDDGSPKEALPSAPAEALAKPGATDLEPPRGGLAEVVSQSITKVGGTGGGRLDRGDVLGHLVVPNASQLLGEVRAQAAPPKSASYVDEGTLRSLASLGLGARAGVASHVVLDQPLGCVLVDDAAIEVPVACAIAYQGGAAAVVTDLGSEGKQSHAAGHVAHYRMDDQDYYLDDMGGHVVVSNHPAVFAKAKDYLARTLLERAPGLIDDVDVVVYPQAIMARYSKQLDAVLSLTRAATPPPGEGPLAAAFTEYSRSSMTRGFDYYRELDQLDVGMGLEPAGFVVRYAIYPTPGSSAQSDSQAVAAGPIDVALVQQLPAASWMVSASTVDWKAAYQLESLAPLRDLALEAYTTAVGRDPAVVRAAVESYLDENAGFYGRDFVLAVAHLPGTQGGMVWSRPLTAPARAGWKPWSEGFTPAMVLGPELSQQITWRFEADALEVEGVAVDRWTLEPGPAGRAALAATPSPALAELERRFGGLKLEIDRVELADRVLFVVAPGAQEQYIRAAILAARGGSSTGSDAGLRGLLARNPDPSVVMAVDVAGALRWAREVLPPEASRTLPTALGVNLGDFYVSATYGPAGEQRGEMVLSQAMIDELRKHAG